MNDAVNQVWILITTYGLNALGAIVILILGRIAAGVGRSIATRALARRATDPAVVSFVSSLTYMLILAFAVVAALAKFGVQTASFVAVVGAVGFAIGFALQGSLSNFAAGVLILVFKPYRIGDYIEVAGVAGTVKEIQLFITVLATPDNIKIMVPNGKIYGDTIKNISAYDTRRVDLVFDIGYSSSIEKAMGVIRGILENEGRILADPAAQIAVGELAESSVKIVARPWVKKDDYWPVRNDLTRRVKEALDEHDIEIPFPSRAVHVVSTESQRSSF